MKTEECSLGSKEVGSIAIDDGGFGGPNYSEDLNSKIDSASPDPCCAWNHSSMVKTRHRFACLRVSDIVL